MRPDTLPNDCLASVMGLVDRSLRLPTAEAVIDAAVDYIEEQTGSPIDLPRALTAKTLTWLARDEEEVHLSSLTKLYVGMMNAELGASDSREFLVGVARRYVDATSYLFHIIHHFARTVGALTARTGRPAHLFLRDAMMFWPSIVALDEPPPTYFILYTRNQQRAGASPRMVERQSDGTFVEGPARVLRSSLMVDAGLYGSLIKSLITQGECDTDSAVLFLGSRNPFIAGWLNIRLTSRLFAGMQADLADVVCVVDTVESLFKPFRMGLETQERNGQTIVDVAEPVTMACSLLFMWSLYRFSRRETVAQESTIEGSFDRLTATKCSPDAWFLFRPIPKWQEAQNFVSTWHLGPLAPMHRISGFTSGLTTPPPPPLADIDRAHGLP